MKKSKYSESRIISILNEHESGIKVSEITRKYCISDATFYNWKGKYGGMSVSQLKKLRELESENIKLKRLYADKSLKCMAMKDVIEKNPKSQAPNPIRQLADQIPIPKSQTVTMKLYCPAL